MVLFKPILICMPRQTGIHIFNVFPFKALLAYIYNIAYMLYWFRAPELMFQPSMMGNLEAGLAEAMDYVFKHFSPEDQLLLANNVFLTGGASQFPGNVRFINLSRIFFKTNVTILIVLQFNLHYVRNRSVNFTSLPEKARAVAECSSIRENPSSCRRRRLANPLEVARRQMLTTERLLQPQVSGPQQYKLSLRMLWNTKIFTYIMRGYSFACVEILRQTRNQFFVAQLT